MVNAIYIAIISASSAITGALFLTLFTYFNNRSQNKFELNKNLLETQKETYVGICWPYKKLLITKEILNFKCYKKRI